MGIFLCGSLAQNIDMNNGNNLVAHVTDDNFERDVLKHNTSVLVDFWASWCGPCKAVAPLLEEIAAEKTDLRVVKLNVDENSKTAQKYNVRAIPTLILFSQGEVVQTKIGAASKSDILKFISQS